MIIRNTGLRGVRGIISGIRSMGQSKVYVGVPSSKNSPHEGSSINMATLAAVHEFGAPSKGIPERSFLRSAIIEGDQQIKDIVAEGVKAYTRQQKQVDLMFYNNIGLFAANLVKEKMVKGPFKPLSDATLKRKSIKNPANTEYAGVSRPLIDTGALRQSISWEVRE